MVAERGHARDVGEKPTELSAEKVVGSRQAAWRIIASGEQKERTKAYEQQAADTREYAIMLEAELQRIYVGILALMDENLIPSASTGEPKGFFSEKKDDYYRFLAERATGVAKRQAPMIQKVLKIVEAPEMQYTDRIVDMPVTAQCQVPKSVSQDRIPQRIDEQLVDIPVPQIAEETVEMFNVFTQDRVQQRIVEQITETPEVSLVEEIVEAPKTQTQEKRIVEESDVPFLNGGCAVQAPEWEELERLKDENFLANYDTNKLPDDSNNLELFKETLLSPRMMQVQSVKRGVARRALAVVRNSSGFPRDNLPWHSTAREWMSEKSPP